MEDLKKICENIKERADLQDLEKSQYRNFSAAFALMSIIPFLTFFYILVARLFTFNILAGDIGLILSVSIFISLGGLSCLMKSHAEFCEKREQLLRHSKFASIEKAIIEIAHEMNSPLQVISGRTQLVLMEGGEDGEFVRENLEIVMAQCKRAKNIINQLFESSNSNKEEVKSE
ncbi:MAG: histidine kinase dimerization/phospho-acceptor domain-containing protein [Candidatus Omnitrophota bacterium]